MAIPNPNPNIRDFEQSDAFTWSSNKIKKEIYSAAELPEVSASDNGEVLGVVEGVWDKMTIPEPDLDPVVIVYKSTPDYPSYFDGMTGAEKIAAIRSLAKSGRLILKEANNSSDYYRVADSDESLNEIRFVKIEDDDIIIKTITYSGTSLSGETTHYSSLPSVTSNDNGDVLTVVEGAWSKATAPQGEAEVCLTFAVGTMTKPSYMASMSAINFMKELKRLVEKGILALRVNQSSLKPIEYNFPDRYITFIEVSSTITSNSFDILIYKIDFTDGNLSGSYTSTTLTGA